MIVKPIVPGVPDPAHIGEPRENYYLPAGGRDVGKEHLMYWARRIRDGEVIEVDAIDPPAPAPAPAPAPDEA